MSTTLKKSFAYSVAAGALALNVAGAAHAWSPETRIVDLPYTQKINTTDTNTTNTGTKRTTQIINSTSPQTFVTQGMKTDPRLPWGIIFGIGGLSLLYGAYAARQNSKMAMSFCVLASGMIVFALSNPTLTQEEHENVPAEVIVAIDKSASQSIGNRKNSIKKASEQILENLSTLPNTNIRVVEIGDNSKNTGTSLFTELEKLHDISKEHVGALFVLTDGQIHDIPRKSPFSSKTPIYGLLTGQPNEKDRSVQFISAPPFALVGKDQTIKFKVNDFGIETISPVKVDITNGDQVIETLDAIPGKVTEVTLKIPHAGTNTIGLEVQDMPGELTKKNNQILTKIEGIREDLNVLLISGAINKNFKTVNEFFRSDPNSNIVPFVMTRLPDDFDNTPRSELALSKFPERDVFRRSLKKFNLVVFESYEDYNAIHPIYMKRLNKYVQKGGGLLIISGPEYSSPRTLGKGPFGKILPVEPTQQVVEGLFKPKITSKGQQHPVTRDLPKGNKTSNSLPEWGSWSRYAKTTPKSGHVLMESPKDDPILVVNHHGKGRVATLFSDELWLWKRGFEGGGPQTELLQRLAHWLMKDPALEEESLHITTQQDNVIVVRQTLSDDVPEPAKIETPSGDIIDVPFKKADDGLWHATLESNEKGLYKATHQHGDKTLKSFTNIQSNNIREFENVVSTNKTLAPLINQTPGTIRRIIDKSGHLNIPDIKVANNQKEIGPNDFYVRPTNQTNLKSIENTPILSLWYAQLLTALLFITTIGTGLARNGNKLDKITKWPRKNRQPSKPEM